uniref:Uncharacterized protein n=1 Tax=Rangifer tarandus platyrhynchus TaxID=3082113 RepID=A0ACB0EEQ0_RANTA|nr:unnamed protein product [Rangifer tarandus platyrhynchus]
MESEGLPLGWKEPVVREVLLAGSGRGQADELAQAPPLTETGLPPPREVFDFTLELGWTAGARTLGRHAGCVGRVEVPQVVQCSDSRHSCLTLPSWASSPPLPGPQLCRAPWNLSPGPDSLQGARSLSWPQQMSAALKICTSSSKGMASGAESGPPKLLGPQALLIRDSSAAEAQHGPHGAPWHFSWQRDVWEEAGLAGPRSPACTMALGAVVPLTFRSQAPGEQGREGIEDEKKKKKLKGQMTRNKGLAAPQVVLSARQLRSREEGPLGRSLSRRCDQGPGRQALRSPDAERKTRSQSDPGLKGDVAGVMGSGPPETFQQVAHADGPQPPPAAPHPGLEWTEDTANPIFCPRLPDLGSPPPHHVGQHRAVAHLPTQLLLPLVWAHPGLHSDHLLEQTIEHAAKGGASLAFSNTLPSRCGTFHLSALCRLRASSPPPGRRVFILRPTPPPWPVLPSAPHASVRPLGALSPPSVRPRSRASAPGAGRRWRVMTSYGPPARDWPQPPHQTPNGRARGRGGARGSHAPGRWAGRGHVTRGAPPPAL